MESITRQVQRGVEECWLIAKRGDELDAALKRLDSPSLQARLDASDRRGNAASLQAQLDSAERIRATRDDTDQRLRLLNTRLGELLAHAAEVSVGADTTGDLGQRRRRRRHPTRIVATGRRRRQQPTPGWHRAGILIAVSSLLRSNVTVAAGTAVSRITGLARVAVFGIVLSQGPVTDAYDQANGTPNMIYELLLGGVLSATLVPLFTRLHDDDDDEATSAVISVGIIVLAAITAIAVARRAADLPHVLAVDVERGRRRPVPHRRHVAGTDLPRADLLLRPQRHRRRGAQRPSPILRCGLGAGFVEPRRSSLRCCSFPAPSIIASRSSTTSSATTSCDGRSGLGATIGIAVMAIALLPALAQAKLRFRFTPSFSHPAVMSLRSLSVWALGYVVANQVAIIVIRNLLRGPAVGDEDAYTKAFTWFVLPHGLLAVSIATTFLPELVECDQTPRRQSVLDRSSLGHSVDRSRHVACRLRVVRAAPRDRRRRVRSTASSPPPTRSTPRARWPASPSASSASPSTCSCCACSTRIRTRAHRSSSTSARTS